MGSQASTEEGIPRQTFSPQVEVISEMRSPFFGKVKIAWDKKIGTEMFIKEVVFHEKQTFEAQLENYHHRVSYPHPNLVNIIGYTSDHRKCFCSEEYKIVLYMDFIRNSLEFEINNYLRRKKPASEVELQLLSEQLIEILYHFQIRGISHGDISPANVFATEEFYKLSDLNFDSLKGENALIKTILFGAPTLLAPELLRQVPARDIEIKCNKYKADVFSLGLTLLSLATLTRSEDLYDYEKGMLNYSLLESRIAQAEKSYSLFFSSFLREILSIDVSIRPDFVSLHRKFAIQESIKVFYEKEAGSVGSKVPYVSLAKTLVASRQDSLRIDFRESMIPPVPELFEKLSYRKEASLKGKSPLSIIYEESRTSYSATTRQGSYAPEQYISNQQTPFEGKVADDQSGLHPSLVNRFSNPDALYVQ